MLERLTVDLEIAEGMDAEVDNALNDKVNDAYGLMYAFACFISPLIGDALNTNFLARTACDISAYANFGFLILLLIFNCGPFVFSENAKFNEKLEELRSIATQEDDTDHNKVVRKISLAQTDFAAMNQANSNKILDEKEEQNPFKKLVTERRKGSMVMSRIARGRLNYVEDPQDRARNYLTRTAERRSIVRANNDNPTHSYQNLYADVE